jgi:hypothetical protein
MYNNCFIIKNSKIIIGEFNMGLTFQRKDNTSIFCPESLPSLKSDSIRLRIIGFFVAISLLSIGTWIMVSY